MSNDQHNSSDSSNSLSAEKDVKQKDAEQKDNSTNTKSLTKGDIAKFGVLVGILLASIVITVALWPYIMQFTTEEGLDELLDTVREAGPVAVGILLILQLLQIIIAFIPGEVVQIVAGVLYGPYVGSAIILVGAFLSTVVIYYVVRKLGRPFVMKMVPKETEDKLAFITQTNRIDIIVFVLFLIPALPKDFITYLVALTSIKPSRFFILSTAGRAPGVFVSSFIGSSIAEGEWVLFVIIVVIAVLILAIFFFKRDMVMGTVSKFAKGDKAVQNSDIDTQNVKASVDDVPSNDGTSDESAE